MSSPDERVACCVRHLVIKLENPICVCRCSPFRPSLIKMKKWLLVVVFVVGLIGLSPLSIRIASPIFSRPYDARFQVPVLLVFPEHVEVRWVESLSEVSPRPTDAPYTFAVPPSKQQWVEQQIRIVPPPRPGSEWRLRIRQLGNNTQRID